jgi:hypothetical protein
MKDTYGYTQEQEVYEIEETGKRITTKRTTGKIRIFKKISC